MTRGLARNFDPVAMPGPAPAGDPLTRDDVGTGITSGTVAATMTVAKPDPRRQGIWTATATGDHCVGSAEREVPG